MPVPSVTVFNFVHPWNALFGILVMDEAMLTVVTFLLFLNAFPEILVTIYFTFLYVTYSGIVTLALAFLFPVYYSESRPLLNLEAIYNPVTKQVCNDKVADAFPSLMWSWITKSLEWERENEWRLISLPIKDDDERSAKLPIISRIITGINITNEHYEIAAKIARDKGVPIHRTRLKNDQYVIEVVENDDT